MERLGSRPGLFEGTRAEEPPPRGRRRLHFHSIEMTRSALSGADSAEQSALHSASTTVSAPPDWSPSQRSLKRGGKQGGHAAPPPGPRLGYRRLPRALQQRYPDVFWDRRVAQIWDQLAMEKPRLSGVDAAWRELGDEAVWSVSSAKPGNGIEMMRDGNVQTFYQTDGAQPHKISIQFLRKTVVAQVRIFLNFQLDESYTPSRIGIWTGSDTHDLRETVVCHLHEPKGWVVIPLPPPAAVLEFNETGMISPSLPPANRMTISPSDVTRPGNEHAVHELDRTIDDTTIPSELETTMAPSEVEVDRLVAAMTTRESRPSQPEQTRAKDAVTDLPSHLPAQTGLETFYIQIVVYSNHQNGRDSHIRQVMVVGPRECGSDLRTSADDDLVFSSNDFASFAALR